MPRRRSRLFVETLECRTVPVAGSLDPSLSNDGLAYANPTQWKDLAGGLVLQPDHKVVVAGNLGRIDNSTSPQLVRFNEDGTLDGLFGTNGASSFSIPNGSGGFGKIVRQPDGKLVAAGTAEIGGHGHLLVARFNDDGSLDTSFDGDGYLIGEKDGQIGYALALQDDGKIVVCGSDPHPTMSGATRYLVARFNTDGSLDATFSGDGFAEVELGPIDPIARAVLVQSDGKIVAGGGTSSSSGNFSFAVVRFNTDGSLDTTFDGDGIAITAPPNTGFRSGEDLAQLPDGRLLLAGTVGLGQNYTSTPTLVRYNTDGSLDTSFNGTGYVITYLGDYGGLKGVTLQPDGKIVAVGNGHVGGVQGFSSIVIRYNADGTLDQDFGPADHIVMPGVVWTDLAPSDNDGFADVVLTPEGKIVATGTAGGGTIQAVGVARYFGAPGNVAVGEQIDATEDTPLSVAAPGVLANDTLIEGNPHAELVDGPGHAIDFTFRDDGSFDYTPEQDFNGADTFTYKLVDGVNSSNVATVTLNVQPVNDPPKANDDAYELPRQSPFTVNVSDGVLANDTDVDGDLLHAVLVDPPTQGSVDLHDDGSFTFTFAPDLPATVSFTYKVNDGAVDGTIGTVTLHRLPNSPPVANDDGYDVPLDSPLVVSKDDGVLQNDTDAEGSNLLATLISPPEVGNLTFQADGSFTFEFPADFVGTTTFTYQASDGIDDSNIATVSLTREDFSGGGGGFHLIIVGSVAGDTIRLRPAANGAIKVERISASGFVAQTIPAPIGAKKFKGIDIYLGDGNDRLDAIGITVPIHVVGGGGDDYLRTGAGADIVFGDAADGTGSGNDVIVTGMGNDSIVAGNGQDVIDAGLGNDTVTAGSDGSFVDAGAGNDLVTAAGGANFLQGGAGRDVLIGGNGADVIDGGAGKDLLAGGFGADVLDGGAGSDILFDGLVNVIDPANDSLAKVLAAYAPMRHGNHAALSTRLAASFDTASADTLTGAAGMDWFWSNDLLDALDIKRNEVRNGV